MKCQHCKNFFSPQMLTKEVYAEAEETDEAGKWFRIDVDETWTAECPFCLGINMLTYDQDYDEVDGFVILLNNNQNIAQSG